MLKADGFDKCVLGTVSRAGYPDIICYDRDMMIDQLTKDGMTHDEAEEFFSFNIEGAHVGSATPCYLKMMTLQEIEEYNQQLEEDEAMTPISKMTEEAVMNYLHHVEGSQARRIDSIFVAIDALNKGLAELTKHVASAKSEPAVIEDAQMKLPLDPEAWRHEALAQLQADKTRTGMNAKKFFELTGANLASITAVFSGAEKGRFAHDPDAMKTYTVAHAVALDIAFGHNVGDKNSYRRFPATRHRRHRSAAGKK